MATAHRQAQGQRRAEVPTRADRQPRLAKALAGGATVAVVAALLAPGSAFAAAQGSEPAPQRLGTAPTAPTGAVRAGGPADSAELNLSVTLNPRDPGSLQSFIGAVSNPNSPEYHHYLKTGEFAQRFGADPATVAAVTKALSDAGLHPGQVGQNGLTIPIKATVAEAKHAFDTDFTGYKLADGTVAYANTQAPKVAGIIASRITGVVGLDNLVKPHAKNVVKDHVDAAPVSATATGVAPRFNSGQPTLCAGIANMEATPTSTRPARYNYQDYYSADALANVYRLPFGEGTGGAGSTVAFFELEDYSDAGVAAYQNCYGTNTPVSRVKVDSGPTAQPALNNSVGMESALDIETVIGLVPNASLLVYQGPDWSVATDQNVLDVYQQMVNDNRAQVISTSWGMCELGSQSPTMAAENVIFQQAAAQGQTVVAASGDSGSTDCYYPGTTSTLDNQLSTDDPASQPYVTGVGGTSMTGGQSSAPSESVWNSNGHSGGGGVSHMWPLNNGTSFQAGVTGTGYSNACGAAVGQTCRQVPDVSALADTAHGYLISSFADSTASYWSRIGGTSGAAPLWGAVIAHANASNQCAGSGPLGYVNPGLYKLNAGILRDITVGNNNLTASGYSGGLYAATAGYDLASGLGTPNADQVTSALCAAAPASPAGTYKAVSPTRLLDTRNGTGAPKAPVPAYGTQTLQIEGNSGVPASGVTAVVLNVTVTNTTTPGHLTVYPSGGALPSTSNLNWDAGTTIPNLVTVPVGKDGSVKLYNGTWGNTDLIVDLQGYYTGDTSGATYVPSGPTRVLDTRNGTGTGTAAQLAPYTAQTLNISGLQGAPAGVSAVVLNVTVTNPQDDGHLTVYPSGGQLPTASNLNWTKGETIPNQVIVPVGQNGSIQLYNGSWAATDVIADVFGYLVTGTNGASFHSATPHRLMDSRLGIGTSQSPFGANEVRTLNLDFGGRLSQAKAVVLNVTVTNTTTPGHLTVFPSGQQMPNTSNLNWAAGQTIPNMVTVPVGPNGTVSIDNGTWGNTDVIVDVFGYYS